jgi:preprotein translocase subunit SecG
MDVERLTPYIGPSVFWRHKNMETFVAILHIVIAVVLVCLVLVQDSKSGSMGGAFGGGGSQSVFGATGATTLAQKLTRWTAILFAVTCISLTIFSNRRSVMDTGSLPIVTPVQATPAAATPAAPAAGATSAAPSAPAAPTK